MNRLQANVRSERRIARSKLDVLRSYPVLRFGSERVVSGTNSNNTCRSPSSFWSSMKRNPASCRIRFAKSTQVRIFNCSCSLPEILTKTKETIPLIVRQNQAKSPFVSQSGLCASRQYTALSLQPFCYLCVCCSIVEGCASSYIQLRAEQSRETKQQKAEIHENST